MTGDRSEILGLPGNPSASLLERVEEVQSMCFMIGLWRVIRSEIGHLERPPPIANGCKVDVRLLGWHHRSGKEGKGQCIRSSRQLAPGEQATLILQHPGPNM